MDDRRKRTKILIFFGWSSTLSTIHLYHVCGGDNGPTCHFPLQPWNMKQYNTLMPREFLIYFELFLFSFVLLHYFYVVFICSLLVVLGSNWWRCLLLKWYLKNHIWIIGHKISYMGCFKCIYTNKLMLDDVWAFPFMGPWFLALS